MIDEIFDRNYQAGRAELNAAVRGGFGRLASTVGTAFAVLNRIEYDAPWASKSRKAISH